MTTMGFKKSFGYLGCQKYQWIFRHINDIMDITVIIDIRHSKIRSVIKDIENIVRKLGT